MDYTVLIPTFFADGFRFALENSSAPGLVICVILVVLSSFSWTVLITKFWQVHQARRRNRQFLVQFHNTSHPLALYARGITVEGAPIAHVYQEGSKEMAFHLTGSTEVDETFLARLQNARPAQPSQMSAIASSLERAVGEAGLQLESSMVLLVTAIAGAPFLGLLGTVWGVMDSFSGVATAQSAAGLKALAPGVSAALVTTVTALLVAIPAMFGYNFLVTRIKALIVRLDNFASELHAHFERFYVDHGGIAAPPEAPHPPTPADIEPQQSPLPHLSS